jgi:pyruvate formate lyase activating enzyme
MSLPFRGRLSSLAVDPIEKKPLYHYLPGTQVLSVGFFGCNMRCPFCQNWSIAQETDPSAEVFSPGRVVQAALEGGHPSLAFTYSEPCVHFEYVLETARLAKEEGLKTVLVTNGYLDEGPARELLPAIDAANVDLKCFSEAAYRGVLGGGLAPVQRFLELAAATCHLEVTTLVVPGLSDDTEQVRQIAAFIHRLDPDIPLHLSAYHPAWRQHEPATRASLVEDLAETARENLRYVYVGNLAGVDQDSYCPVCGERLIRREGYSTRILGLETLPPTVAGEGRLEERHVAKSRCKACRTELPFILSAAGAARA